MKEEISDDNAKLPCDGEEPGCTLAPGHCLPGILHLLELFACRREVYLLRDDVLLWVISHRGTLLCTSGKEEKLLPYLVVGTGTGVNL